LIIEDERPLADALASNLEHEGFEVFVADDGRRGLQRAQKTLPDLIVLDLMLPDLPGLVVCRSVSVLRTTRPSIQRQVSVFAESIL
jgi:DNA-binding response OmpR family regulator